jgi:lipopolysaccharide transport system permease protein
MTDLRTPLETTLAPPSERWVVNRAPSRRLTGIDLAEAWRHRELALILASRTFKLRYRQTFFGVAWALLQPLVALAIFSVIFGRYAKLPAEGIPYAVFVYPALCLWTYVSSAVGGAAVELIDHQELVTKVYFPRVLAPVAALLPGLVDLAVSLVLAAILVAATGQDVGWALVLLPLWIALVVLAALGLGVLLSAINVRFRDVRHTLPFVLQTWFFVSPIVYASSLVGDGALRVAYALNPLVLPIDGLRWSLVGAKAPPLADLASLVTIAVLVTTGIFYFRASERRFADLI